MRLLGTWQHGEEWDMDLQGQMEDGHHTCDYNSNEHKMSLIIAETLRFPDT